MAPSAPAGRVGRQEPTFRVMPQGGAYTDGDDAADLCAHYWFEPDPWQRGLLRDWLTRDADGKLLVLTAGLSVPRQNGKNGAVEALEFYLMVTDPSVHILHTAHLVKTCKKAFNRLARVFGNRRNRSIYRLVRKVSRTNGEEGIYLWHPDHIGDPSYEGASIEYSARSRGSARGFDKISHVVYDEAQELTDEQQASFTPCLSASSNPQTVYAGTPPDESAPGVVFRRIRDRALSGFPGRAWTEWSVDEIGDPHDKSRWYETNPSLGILILEESVESESIDFAADKFARERLGWWQPVISDVPTVIDAEQWALCETDDPPFEGELFVGVKAGLDVTSLSVCIKPVDGVPYVEWVGSHPASDGIGWIATWLTKRRDEIGSVGIDGRTASEALVQRLARLGFPKSACKAYGSSDIVKATSLFVNAVSDAQVSHYGQQELTDSATKTERRTVGGGFAFRDASGADATIVESCAIAYRQAASSKGKPKGMRIG